MTGPATFAPLHYPHKPDMAQWLNGWAGDYDRQSLEDGMRCFKVHVQVGGLLLRDVLYVIPGRLLALDT